MEDDGTAEVLLRFAYDEDGMLFDLKTWRGLPCLVFHELICHAFQGLAGNPWNARKHTSQADAFAEGWMDEVAFQIVTSLWTGLGLEKPPYPAGYDEVDALHSFHKYRMSTGEFHVYRLGAHNARRFQAFVFRLPGFTEETARAALYRCSFDLNLLRLAADPYPPYLGLSTVLAADVAEAKVQVVEGFTAAVREYLDGGPAEQFAARMARQFAA
jgi:hypothetical protein